MIINQEGGITSGKNFLGNDSPPPTHTHILCGGKPTRPGHFSEGKTFTASVRFPTAFIITGFIIHIYYQGSISPGHDSTP